MYRFILAVVQIGLIMENPLVDSFLTLTNIKPRSKDYLQAVKLLQNQSHIGHCGNTRMLETDQQNGENLVFPNWNF